MSETTIPGLSTPVQVADDWISRFASALEASDPRAVAELVAPGGWWRDLLALSWDLRTFRGGDQLEAALQEGLRRTTFSAIRLDAPEPKVQQADDQPGWIELLFRFATQHGHGRGVARLVETSEETWKAWTVLLQLEELRGFEEPRGTRRPLGVTHGAQQAEGSWRQRRERERAFADRDPEVLVVGAGQGGLMLAARLRQCGIDALCVERNTRIGDNWRQRYESLVLHDPVWADHLPYVPFPDTWPIFTPKDRLAGWLESYAETMELNVWTETELTEASYDEAAGRWDARVRRAGQPERTLRPRHLVLATGLMGRAHVPEFAGVDDYTGDVHHSSAHPGSERYRGRRAIVIGACNSGHDIAQDLHEHGVEVTMVQRSPTYVLSSAHGTPALFGGLYFEGGPDLDDADLLNASYPWGLLIERAKDQTQAIAELDRALLEGLAAAGFQLDMGIDGGGLMSKAMRSGGGYYIDVGCSQLIVDGKVKIKAAGVDRFTPTGVRLDDGSELDADLVVLATGYGNMRDAARGLLPDDVLDRVRPVWGLDDEGEVNTAWRRTEQPGLWFMAGSLMIGRVYSRFLALQIKAALAGITAEEEQA